MKILILGGAGFIGGALAASLSARHSVVAVDNLSKEDSEYRIDGQFFRRDIRVKSDWVLPACDVVIDCTTDTESTQQVLDYCKRHEAGLIFLSTSKVYGQRAIHRRAYMEMDNRFASTALVNEMTSLDGGDKGLYGARRLAGDLLAQEYAEAFDIPVVVNRLSTIVGPWSNGWVTDWIVAHRLGQTIRYQGYHGKQVRDILYIDDLCKLIEMQIDNIRPGAQVFNVGGGHENTLSLRDCTTLCQRITGLKVQTAVEEARRADVMWYVSDIAYVKEMYPWEPVVTVEGGLRQVDRWVVENLEMLAARNGMYVQTNVRELRA